MQGKSVPIYAKSVSVYEFHISSQGGIQVSASISFVLAAVTIYIVISVYECYDYDNYSE